MIGITLSSEQIRAAPADVRQWVEREVIASLGLQGQPANVERPQRERLASCSAEEAAAILAQIQGVLPAVNVFFEFGRQGAIVEQAGLEAFRLVDIAHHAHLQPAQVLSCLELINEAFGRARKLPDAIFCGFDREGHCFVTVETQQNILHLWQSVIANQQLAFVDDKQPASTPSPKGDAPRTAAPVFGGPGGEQPIDRWAERDEEVNQVS
jgi:hypothetical protein